MEDGLFAEDDVAVAELGRDQHLEPVLIGERKPLPAAVLGRRLIVIHYHEIESTVKAGNELPCLSVAMNAAQYVTGRNGDVILDEFVVYARIVVLPKIEQLDVRPSKILEDRLGFEEQHSVEFRGLNLQRNLVKYYHSTWVFMLAMGK